MNNHPLVVSFADVAWQQVGPSCRKKELVRGQQLIRLLEFQKGFEEDGWCEKGHAGYVVAGELNLEFVDQTITAKLGDAIFIPAGHETRHRAHVVGESAQLILFENYSSDGSSS